MTATLPPLDLYAFQREDVDNLHANDECGIVVAEPGAGKTLLGVELGRESEAEVILVLAPAAVIKKEWVATIRRQDPDAIIRNVGEDRSAMDDLMVGLPGWYLVSHTLFTTSEGWSAIRPDLTILDEAHKLSNRDSKGGKKLRKELRSRRRVAMSGTIWYNHIENAWNLISWVYPELDGPYEIADKSFHRWARYYCETAYDPFNPQGYKIVGEKDPGTLAGLIPCYIQHFKREECCEHHPNGFLPDLEAPEHVTLEVDLNAEQKKMMQDMELDYIAYLEQVREDVVAGSGDKRLLIAKMPIVARTRRRQMTLGVPSLIEVEKPVWLRDEDGKVVMPKVQIDTATDLEVHFAPGCASPKLDKAIERLHEEGDRTCVMVMSSQRFAVEAVRRLNEQGISAAEFSGKVSARKRDELRDDFAAGRVRVIVAVTEAIGTGIDGLQFSCNWLLVLEHTDDLTAHTQLLSRLDRRGQTEQVLIEEIVARGSMDFGIIDRGVQRQLSLNRSLKREMMRLAA